MTQAQKAQHNLMTVWRKSGITSYIIRTVHFVLSKHKLLLILPQEYLSREKGVQG